MAVIGTIRKQPREAWEVVVDLSKIIAKREATISVAVEVPAGMTQQGTPIIGADGFTIYVAGGTSGAVYVWTLISTITIGTRQIIAEDEVIVYVNEVTGAEA